ncbi:MAG: DUF3326 domain-containing protein, partial [Nitrososphaerales archaeon]
MMLEIYEREVRIPNSSTIASLNHRINRELWESEIPVRFVVTASDETEYQCEIGVLVDKENRVTEKIGNLFEFRRRGSEAIDKFNAVLLIPTGIGAEIGGHAGDSTAVAQLLAQNCDTLVIHPNIVNASDINEMPPNSLYVEGSIITRMLMGTIGLQPVRANRVLVVIDQHESRHFIDIAINSVSAARAIYGLNCPEVVCLETPIRMKARYAESGRAVGHVTGLERCLEFLEETQNCFDAIAFSSTIHVPFEYHLGYFERKGEMVNPWGGVEAMLTHTMSSIFNVSTAHSPMFENQEIETLETGIVDPRMAAEAVSGAFLQCILKGLQRSPKIITDPLIVVRSEIFSVEDVSCLVIPNGCLGLPTLAALEQ